MLKSELSELFKEVGIPANEGISSESNKGAFPRVVYYCYIEEDIMSSGEDYANHMTFQIDYWTKKPNDPKFNELREALREKGIHPQIFTEYVEEDPVFSKCWHKYFAIEVVED